MILSSALLKRIKYGLRGRVITLHPKGERRGRVLLSHDISGFFRSEDDPLTGHGHFWVAKQIAQTFLDKGYSVDVISYINNTFRPHKQYTYAVDIGENLERLAPFLNSSCKKILHITGAHWLFQNTAEYKRCLDIQHRRGVVVYPRRVSTPSRAIEIADFAHFFGNEFTKNTYAFSKKELFPTPMPTTETFPFSEQKDFETVRRNFIWLGGAGAAHKGLDLILEAFAGMPDYHLTVCGKVEGEEDFAKAFQHELHETPNITLAGHMNTGGPAFRELCEKSLGIVFASCSEGQAGSVVVAMHAGLIPIISYESGIDVEDFGSILKENTVEGIQDAIRTVSALPEKELRDRARRTWTYANTYNTREYFAKQYRAFIDKIESQRAS